MATRWFYCALLSSYTNVFFCLACTDLAGKATNDLRTAAEGLMHVWLALPKELNSCIKVIQYYRDIPVVGGGGDVTLSSSLQKLCV
jgi:hypothetical protein